MHNTTPAAASSHAARKTAVMAATDEIKTQMTAPARREMQEAVAHMNVCGQEGNILATKAVAASGGMHEERAKAIEEHKNMTDMIIQCAIDVEALQASIKEIDTEIKDVLMKPTTSMSFSDKEKQTEKLNALRKTTVTQRDATEKLMITCIDENEANAGGKDWKSQELTELKVPKNLKSGKGQE